MTAWSFGGDASLSRFSLDRRVTVLVFLLTVVVLGAVAVFLIPLELFPRGFTSPSLSVRAPWPDAPPREVQDKVTIPLEEELSTVRGQDRIVSLSLHGYSRVYLRLKQGTDMNVAYREVRDRIERARRRFPADVDRVYVGKEDPSGFPVVVLGVAVDPSLTNSYDLIQNEIIEPIRRLDGVASVEAEGLEEKEILIELDREKVAAHGLNVYRLAMELQDDNFTMASGKILDGSRKLLLRSVARYRTLEDIENRLVSPSVRLRDIARVTYEEPEKLYRVRAMSKPAYAVVVFKEGEANAVDVSRRVGGLVERFDANPRLRGVDHILIFSQGEFINESMTTLLESGMIGGVIAATVLFLFLRRFRMMLIIALSIPFSMLTAVTVMYLVGETLNIVSLLALMVCVGLLVDNAVVVGENIHRLNREGLDRRQACIRGASEIGLAITMSTLTTIVVFLPVALVEGQAQFFFLRMAVPITIALLASLVAALVCVPLAVYLTLPVGERREGPGRFLRLGHRLAGIAGVVYDHTFRRLGRGYNRLLGVFLVRRFDLVLGLVGIFALTMAASSGRIEIVDTQKDETPGFSLCVRMPDHSTLEETEEWFLSAERAVETHAEELGLEGWFHFHGKVTGEIQGWFTNPRSTDLTLQEVTERVLELLPEKPGVEVETCGENPMEEAEGQAVYVVTLNSEDNDRLADAVDGLEEFFPKVEGVLAVRRESEEAPNELGLVVDRERAQHYGVNPRVVAGVVGYALRGTSLPRFTRDGKEIPVRIRFEKEDRESLDELASFYVPTDSGEVVALSAVTAPRMLSTPDYIVRVNKRTSRTITLELEEEGKDETRKRLDAIVAGIDLPEGISFGASQSRDEFQEDLANIWFAGGLSIVFIYLLMGFLFESFILPLSIITTIPLASVGVIWLHILTGRDIDFLGAVGIVLLIGVVVNNGIVLIDYVNRLRAQGLNRTEALRVAAERRFRPIMMTAITTIGGLLPLAFAGRNEMGISYTSFSLSLIGGMTTATLLTLLVVPVFYTFFDDLRETAGAAVRRVLARRAAPSRAEA